MTYLTDDQIAEARRLWGEEKKTLGEITKALGEDSRGAQVGIYHLSPWLYADTMKKELEALGGKR